MFYSILLCFYIYDIQANINSGEGSSARTSSCSWRQVRRRPENRKGLRPQNRDFFMFSTYMNFQVLLLAAWPTFTTIFYSWNKANFSISSEGQMFEGLIFQRCLCLSFLWCAQTYFCGMAGRATFTTIIPSYLRPILCISGDANIFNGLIFQRCFVFVALLCFRSGRNHTLCICRLAEIFMQVWISRIECLFKTRQSFSRHIFLVHFKRCVFAHMVTFSLFLCTRICGNMVWPVFLWIGPQRLCISWKFSSRSVFGFRFLSF